VILVSHEARPSEGSDDVGALRISALETTCLEGIHQFAHIGWKFACRFELPSGSHRHDVGQLSL
jgi:hypothetical protein